MKPKQTIIYTLLLALLLIAGGISAGTAIRNRLQNGLIDNYAGQEQAIGREVSNTLQGKISNAQNALAALALNPDIQSSNPTVCNQALQQAIDSLQLDINNIGRVNSGGTFYCSINKALIGTAANKYGSYVQQLIDDPQHQPVVSRQLTLPNVHGYAVAIHVPVYSASHAFIGTIGGAIYLDKLASSYLDGIKFANTGYASIQDDNGDIFYTHLAGLNGKNYWSPSVQGKNADLTQLNIAIRSAEKGASSTVRYTNYLGVKKIASVIPITVAPNHDWVVLVNVPISEISVVFVHTGINSAFNVLAVIYFLTILLILLLTIASTIRSSRLQKAEDQFVSLVSHQLRTPLTSIRLFTEMLEDNIPGKLNPKQAEYVDKIHISTVRMIRLVGDILNVSHVSLGRLKVEPKLTNLNQLIQANIDEIQPVADQHGTAISVNLPKKPIVLLLDPTLFNQIVHNLLTNAVRYCNDDTGTITISLSSHKDSYQLSVADNGIGIPKKAQKKIFKQFYRANNAMTAVGEGTGLGLYMVKMIANRSGCIVSFVSREGHGTTFTVTIPKEGMKPTTGDRNLL